MMEYNPTCVERDECRFVLKQTGKKPLIVIGLNPSTANANESDATMRRIMGYAERNGFDSFIMFNLYPQRTTNPNGLDSELDESKHESNLEAIKDSIKGIENPTILLGYGNNIRIRGYLKKCLKDIIGILMEYTPSFVKIGQYTKMGVPRHPSRGSYKELTQVDINSLI